jgi:3-oxoacyl-[acyl-carrier-protein] synthase-1
MLAVTNYTITNALGVGRQATLKALQSQQGALRPYDLDDFPLTTYIGRVEGLEKLPVDNKLAAFDCRNNRLAQLCLQQDDFQRSVGHYRQRFGADRIAVILGTSTSGIDRTEWAFIQQNKKGGLLPAEYDFATSQSNQALTDFVRQYLQLTGPSLTISTACSASAKVFACAERLIEQGWADAAVVGGADCLALTTLFGFNSLELTAPEPCQPCDAKRCGLNIGEGAGFALLTRADQQQSDYLLLGTGESSDAYHMSSPHPQALGAKQAIKQALQQAHCQPADIDYINMHGTATRVNDASEDLAISEVIGTEVPCSSTKGWSGHTLGAAGITEAAIALLCLEQQFIPGTLNTTELDPSFTSRVVLTNQQRPVNRVMSNSFGFGGSNCCLIFGRG